MSLGLADLSIRRPIFAVMLIGALVVLGLISMPRLEVGLLPDVDMPIVTVTTRLSGAGPESVERTVTQPLEETINTIGGLDDLFSTSSEGISRIIARFELEQDITARTQDVRDKVAEARARLPVEAEASVVQPLDADSQPILSILLSGPLPIRSLSELADKQVKQRLEHLSGVGSVTLVGDRKREIRIWLDPLRLAGHGLAVDDVFRVLKREHVEIPAGRIETRDTEYLVKTKGKLTSTEHFGALVLAQRADRAIHLRDVALVEDGMAAERTIARLNGQRGVSLRIRRQSGANAVAVAKAVKAELEEIRSDLPANISMVVAEDTTVFIEQSLREVRSNLLIGGLLAVLVIFAFLRSWRSTLVASLAIPSALVASFVFFYAFGFTLNNLTLIALCLSIGMLIDDAIVVVENVQRHVELGEPRMEAAARGTREIGLAVVATTLAICAVFVPIAFMRGIVGRFFMEFGLVVTFAVCTSTLVALTLTPMLCSRTLSVAAGHGVAYMAMERGYRRLEAWYGRVLAWCLGHRAVVVGVALAAIVAGLGIASTVRVDFAPASDRGEFNVWIKLAPGTPLRRTFAAGIQLEQVFLAHPETRAVFTTVGGGPDQRVNEATLYVKLTRSREREQTQDEIMDELRHTIRAQELPLVDFTVEHIPWMNIQGARHYTISWALRGPDTDRLNLLARQLMARMEAAGGFRDLSTSYEIGKPEIALNLNRELAADLGVSASQIGNTISALLGNLKVTSFEEGGDRYDVRVQLQREYRDDPAELGLLNVRAHSGELINLANLVTPRIETGPVQIERQNRARAVTLRGNLAPGKPMGEAIAEVERFIAELEIPSGYEIEATGQTEAMKESLDAMLFAFGLALIATYMILASQFNSLVHPLTIMLSAPLSFIGAFAALALTGQTLEMMTQIGFLMLMGLVMKNGILLVDYTNQLRERGLALREAVLEAGPTRLRPVLMTTFSTVFGMIPLATTGGEGAEFRGAMGIIVIGGLLASMFLTLLIVPVAYTLMDAGQSGLLRVIERMRGYGARSRHSPPVPTRKLS